MLRARTAAAVALVLAFAWPGVAEASGGTTVSGLTIGGPGSCSSEGFNDPGLLSDGLTEASGTYVLELDPVGATLTVTVTNTSPVSVGIPNPLITQIYFNAPVEVTGMTLVSQVPSGGADDFELTFDADLGSAPNPNGADGFGAFSVALVAPNGIQGGIANAAADTLPGPAPLVGPVVFTFDLTGALGGLTADDFTDRLSVIPPGNKQVHGVGHFAGGGVAGASAFISDGAPPICPEDAMTAVLGVGCGADLSATLPLAGEDCTVTIDSVLPLRPGVILVSPAGNPALPFQGCDVWLKPGYILNLGGFLTDANGDAAKVVPMPSKPIKCGQSFVIQGFVLGSGGPVPLGAISNGVVLTIGS